MYVDVNMLCEAWIALLRRLNEEAHFKWYATLTFRAPIHPEAAMKCFNRWIHQINRKILGVRYWKRNKGVRWVMGIETQRRGVIHFHCLIADVGNLRRLTWMDRWDELAGYARIYAYDNNRDPYTYLSKYITKGGDIELGGDWVSMEPKLPF